MSHRDFEEECARLRVRVAELEAQLRISAPEKDETRLLRAALKSLPEGVIICDAEGNRLYFNPVASEYLEYNAPAPASQDEWSSRYGLYLPDAVTPFPTSELPLVRALRGEDVKGVEMFVRTSHRPEGAYVECDVRPVHDAAGRLCGAVGVFRDIGERKRWKAAQEEHARLDAQRLAAEKEKLEMARLLRTLLDHLDVVVWSMDEKGTFTFQDGHGLANTGLKGGQLVGQNLFELYPAHLTEGPRQALSGTAVHDVTYEEAVTWENWSVPVAGPDGKITGAIGMSLNVTEVQKAKSELENKLALVERQQDVIRNLETPVIQVWDHVLTLPMVGIVDSRRAARVTDDLLEAVTRTQARYAVLDLTGVDIVDTSTAAHIINIITAVRLLGAEGIITGIRPNVAQTMVSLGLDLTRVITLATLRDGLAFAMRQLDKEKTRAR